MKKLAEGRGNLIAQTESFRQLGVEVKRPINPRLVEQAMPEEPEASDSEDNDDLPFFGSDRDDSAARVNE